MSRVSRGWTDADRVTYSELFYEVLGLEEAGRAVPGLRLRLDRLSGRYVRHLRTTLGPRKAARRSYR